MASLYLLSLQSQLIYKYINILHNESHFLKLKAKIHWLHDGDKNTKFFHHSIQTNRKKLKISCLLDSVGYWLFESDKLASFILNYFHTFYHFDHDYCDKHINILHDVSHPLFPLHLDSTLVSAPTFSKFHIAIFSRAL